VIEEKIYSAPNHHSDSGRRADYKHEDWNDFCLEYEASHNHSQQRGEEHRQRHTPELFQAGRDFRLKELEEISNEKPENRKWNVDGGKAREERQIGFAVGDEADEGDEGNGKDVTQNDGFFHNNYVGRV
jgi:hypothetical protein